MNGSFQNQTTSCFPSGKSTASRKRGIAAALQDATNIVPPSQHKWTYAEWSEQ